MAFETLRALAIDTARKLAEHDGVPVAARHFHAAGSNIAAMLRQVTDGLVVNGTEFGVAAAVQAIAESPPPPKAPPKPKQAAPAAAQPAPGVKEGDTP